MDFLKDVLRGVKRYFLISQVQFVKVPFCHELTVERVLAQVRAHREIMQYLPDLPEKGTPYVERDFLFTIVNTLDSRYFKAALAELEHRRALRAKSEQDAMIEIDSNLLNLLEKVQSRLSGQKLVASRRAMG